VAYLWSILGVTGVLGGLAWYEDWYATTQSGHAFRLAIDDAKRDGRRIEELAKSPSGIPPQGAGLLMENDPLTQGPRLFREHCIQCHQPASSPMPFATPPLATDLVDGQDRELVHFASRDWIRSLLLNFEGHYQNLRNIEGPRQTPAQAILTGTMSQWSAKHRDTLQADANAADFDALVEFLYAQSRRKDALLPSDARVQRGQQIFKTGQLVSGQIDACAKCHGINTVMLNNEGKVVFNQTPLSDAGQPLLSGYGGTNWLEAFIANPAAVYGNHNAMPPFGNQLTKSQIRMLAQWLAENYYQSEEH
ncbi:MAG: c-type cytochrome, partial [Planctomycetaceae bacterium]|nr:c-type cytochrome [Planctomycetaceae bacterium]